MNKWLNSKFYFFFWMFLALFPMKYVYNLEHASADQNTEQNIEYSYEQSSVVDEDFLEDEEAVQKISDEELIKILELSPEEYKTNGAPENPYALSPEQLDEFERNLREGSGLSEDAEIDFSPIAADQVAVNYENVTTCSAKNKIRANVERVIERAAKQNALFAEAVSERSIESELMPRKCVTHVMNKFNIGKNSLARCPGGVGTEPQRGGAKPCVSKNLVNLTYNHFTDVAECLNIAPKDLLPKLSNESGMLINTLGAGFDAGVGQLTQSAIEEVNKYYDRYLAEMEKATIKKPSCLRVLQYKTYLKKGKDNMTARCSFIVPPDNPLKNIMYMAIYNRLNLDYLLGSKYIAGENFIESNGQLIPLTGTAADQITGGKFGTNKIPEKFARLGLTNVNYNNMATMIAFAGYNTGPTTAFNMLNEYLTKRLTLKKPAFVTEADFDFHNPSKAKDIDGKIKTVTEIARLYAHSPFINSRDTIKVKAAKAKRAKLLSEKIRRSHLMTFPEFMIYNQNNFDSSILNPSNLAKVAKIQDPVAKAKESGKYERFTAIGAPGYLSFLASKDSALRQAFENSGADKYYCSNPNFLRVKDANLQTPAQPPVQEKPQAVPAAAAVQR